MSDVKLKKKLQRFKQSSTEDDNATIDRYLRVEQGTTVRTGIQYIGLEIECFGKITRVALQKLFFKYDLEEYVVIGTDSSIRPPGEERINRTPAGHLYTSFITDYNSFELRLLIPQTELKLILKKFGRIFRLARLQVNESCGLHVHLDMRQRDHEICFQKLLNFQDALFAIVKKDRWNNEFCQQTEEGDEDHHKGINIAAYDEHETIEVRMHHGCLNTDQIEKWVRLLINVTDAKSVPKVSSKKDVMNWKGLSKPLRGYINRNFKSEWFKEKEGFDY